MPLSDSSVLAVTTAMEAWLATRDEPRSSFRDAPVLRDRRENRVQLASDLESTPEARTSPWRSGTPMPCPATNAGKRIPEAFMMLRSERSR